MGFADKAKDKAEELAGKAKATVGDKTDNPDLEAEGRMQEAKADVKQAGENVKDSG
ncbi:MAG TPA: CsbD family protein, partial [Propionibacteriaceae bacterium]|nr:CsbD family protein [Propionibacteriaceae bacterium]